MNRRIINPWKYQERGGWVHANEIVGGQRILFCAGQTSVDSEGEPLHVGDMRAQMKQAFDNLETVLREAGFSLSDVVRLTYYTTDVDRYNAEFEVLKDRLVQSRCRAASTLLEVSRLAFPQLLIEIEATAMK